MNAYQLVISGFQGPQFYQNVMYFQSNDLGGTTPYDLAAEVVDTFDSLVSSDFFACIPILTTVTSYRAKRVTGGGGATYVVATNPATAHGTRTGDVSASMVGPVLLSRAVLNGKNITGKTFLAGISESDITENVIIAALKTAVNTLGTLLHGPLTGTSGSTIQFVVYNRATKTYAIPSGINCGVIPGAQRRRMRPVF